MFIIKLRALVTNTVYLISSLLQQENLENKMPESLQAKHEVIISELKAQLDDLESFAYKQVVKLFQVYVLLAINRKRLLYGPTKITMQCWFLLKITVQVINYELLSNNFTLIWLVVWYTYPLLRD